MTALNHSDLNQLEATLCASRDALLDSIRARLALHGGAAPQLNQSLARLRTINNSLKRIDFGVAGACSCCGAEIGAERLRANPTAIVCADCDDGQTG